VLPQQHISAQAAIIKIKSSIPAKLMTAGWAEACCLSNSYIKNTQANISLCFIKHRAITTYVEVEVQFYSFLICAKNTGFLLQTQL
jgi:hypothetical protein